MTCCCVRLVNQAILLVRAADHRDLVQADAGEDDGLDRAVVALQRGELTAEAVASIPHALSATPRARNSRQLKILSSRSMCRLEKGSISQANASSSMTYQGVSLLSRGRGSGCGQPMRSVMTWSLRPVIPDLRI